MNQKIIAFLCYIFQKFPSTPMCGSAFPYAQLVSDLKESERYLKRYFQNILFIIIIDHGFDHGKKKVISRFLRLTSYRTSLTKAHTILVQKSPKYKREPNRVIFLKNLNTRISVTNSCKIVCKCVTSNIYVPKCLNFPICAKSRLILRPRAYLNMRCVVTAKTWLYVTECK